MEKSFEMQKDKPIPKGKYLTSSVVMQGKVSNYDQENIRIKYSLICSDSITNRIVSLLNAKIF